MSNKKLNLDKVAGGAGLTVAGSEKDHDNWYINERQEEPYEKCDSMYGCGGGYNKITIKPGVLF